MKKAAFFVLIAFLLAASSAFAQTAFWSFDENNNQTLIPPQCDGQFDETRGGVYLPSPEELYEQGELFLLERGSNRNGAGYCFLAAALQDYVPAQYRVAQLYNKGVVLPQNDLAAYRWAFIAALNGHKEAEQMTLMLEQFLTAEDIQMATRPVEQMLPGMSDVKTSELATQTAILEDKRAQLESINKDIDLMLGITPITVNAASVGSKPAGAKTGIFNEADRLE